MNEPSQSFSPKDLMLRALISIGKVIMRLASMMGRQSAALFRAPKFAEAITTMAGVLIVTSPFVYSFFQFRHQGLESIPNYDSFAYLWSGPLSMHFIAGRSLLQRAIFYLLSNNTFHIHIFQHLLFATTAVLWLWVLKPVSKLRYLTVSLLVAWIAASAYLSHQSLFIAAEPIYEAFVLIFPATVVYAGRGSGARWWWGVLPVGILAILTKNVAPFYVVGVLLLSWAIRLATKQRVCRANWIVMTMLIVLSVLRLHLTMKYDTSVHVNAVNNYYSRVFPYPERTALFASKYGMPTGTFVAACSGSNILTAGFDGQSLLFCDFANTHNYSLIDDRYGFASWIRTRGVKAWQSFLFRNTFFFLRNFRSDYARIQETGRLLNPAFHLVSDCPPTAARQRLEIHFSSHARGLLNRGDALELLSKLMATLGLQDIYRGLCAALICFGLVLYKPAKYFSAAMELAIVMIVVSVGLGYISYYGDGMEHERHLATPYLAYCIGLLLALSSGLASTASLTIARLRDRGRPPPGSESGSIKVG